MILLHFFYRKLSTLYTVFLTVHRTSWCIVTFVGPEVTLYLLLYGSSEVENHLLTSMGLLKNLALSFWITHCCTKCCGLYVAFLLNYLPAFLLLVIIVVALYFQAQYEFIYRAIQHYISTETARLNSDNVRISGMCFSSYFLTIPFHLSICSFICSLILSIILSFLSYFLFLMTND